MKRLALLAGAAALALSVASQALAADITLQASSKSGDWAMQYYSKWVDKWNTMVGEDGPTMEVLPTQAVVPHRETIDAVANGILSGDLNAVSYFTGRDQAFSILGDLIAGYDTVDQMQAFCMIGGGKEVLQKVYDKYTDGNIKVIGCGPYAREAFVSTKPINTVDDMKGLKVRSPEGMASEVFKRAGASPVALPFSEVYTSLEKGLVEAADASAHVNNDASGMYKVAKYPIYPGIHSMAVLQFVMNKDQYDQLSDAHKEMLEVWYTAMNVQMARQADMEDKELARKQKEGGDVTVIDWAQEERDKFREIAVEAWEDTAAKSPLAREALDAHLAFMKKIGLLDEEAAAN